MTDRYLINADFKAIRKGNYFLRCDSSVGEFIIDRYNIKLTSIQICEIGISNGLKLRFKDKKSNNLLKLIDHLNALKIGEITQMTQIQIVTEIINKGFEEGRAEDKIIVEMIESGIAYKAAGKMYNQIACDEGHIMNRIDRKKAVWKILDEEKFAPTEYVQVENVAVRFSENLGSFPGLDRTNALRLIKAWAVLNKVELPKKLPQGPKRHLIGVGFRGAVMTWMLENAHPSVEELAAKIGELQKNVSDEKCMQKAKKFYEYYMFADAVRNI